jgi:competence protein ComEC
MKLLNFNVIYITLFLILGIAVQNYAGFHLWNIILWGSGSVIIVFALQFIPSRKSFFTPIYSVNLAIVFFCLGAVLLSLRSPAYLPNHYSQFPHDKSHELVVKIDERIKSSIYHKKYYAHIISLDGKSVNGRILLNQELETSSRQFHVDDLLIAQTELQQIATPLNPHQFNYAHYLQNRGIHHQIYLNASNHQVLSSGPSGLFGYAALFRRTIQHQLESGGFNDSSIQMINALLLGQKQDIDPDLYNNFIKAGTVHILAVSGLHVGIILLILTWLFKPLLHLKYGRILRSTLIVVLLWLFAFTAGLSPSVTRAVTMFSIVAIAMHLRRQTNIYNTLATSALLLLLINPNLLFEVGFQLSYTAVLSIVMFQPLIVSVWTPKFGVVNYLWQVFGVTLAAQLGVAPLSLFYFHQFPGLFFLSNVVVVPFLGVLLGFGLLVVALSLLNFVPKFLVTTFEWLIDTLNGFIAWIAQFEKFLFKDIPFDGVEVLLSYGIFICLFAYCSTRRAIWMGGLLTIFLLFQIYLTNIEMNEPFEKLIVFNKSREGIIGIQKEYVLHTHHRKRDSLGYEYKFLKNYVVGERIKEWKTLESLSVFKIADKTVLVMDSLGLYQRLSFKPDVLVLQYSPKVNFDRLLKVISPEQVVADASNYRSYVKRWEKSCKKNNTSFHYTAEAGAFILK